MSKTQVAEEKVIKCISCSAVTQSNDGECQSCGSDYVHADIVGQKIDISVLTEDNDLDEWCQDHGWNDLLVVDVDHEGALVWVKDCPYAIQVKDIS